MNRALALSLLVAISLPSVARAENDCTPGTAIGESRIAHGTGGLVAALADEDRFGASVASLGDLDGDGVVDVAVGAPGDDTGGVDRGAVHVLMLNADGTVKAERKIAHLSGGFGALSDEDEFGAAVDAIGDLDGDGVGDLAVGAPGDSDGAFLPVIHYGAVWICFLNADGTVKSTAKISEIAGGFAGGLKSSDEFGASLAAIGDLDGDGVTELAVGAPGDDEGTYLGGSVYVLSLTSAGAVTATTKLAPKSAALGFDPGAVRFGSGLGRIPDQDQDGRDELAVGAVYDDDGGLNLGAVYVLSLNADGTAQSHRKISQTSGGFQGSFQNGSRFGSDVTAIGDVDQDGVDDLVVGAYWADGVTGGIWTLCLDASGDVADESLVSGGYGGLDAPPQFEDFFGASVCALGDLDGDGIDDVLVGSPGADDGGPERGAVTVVRLGGMWIDAENALAGVNGAPVLDGSGDLVPGASTTLALSNAAPDAAVLLFVGLTKVDVETSGGVLVPAPDLMIVGLGTDPTGALSLAAPWPATVPSDTSFYFQAWVADAAAPFGYSASNGVAATTP
ncbi:MAG: integrin alpha [Planctomycetota bacterium JB042]